MNCSSVFGRLSICALLSGTVPLFEQMSRVPLWTQNVPLPQKLHELFKAVIKIDKN
jgi:hypothetical protein